MNILCVETVELEFFGSVENVEIEIRDVNNSMLKPLAQVDPNLTVLQVRLAPSLFGCIGQLSRIASLFKKILRIFLA